MGIESISIRYGDLELVAAELRSVGTGIADLAGRTEQPSFGKWSSVVSTTQSDLTRVSEDVGSLADILDKVAALCEEKERAAKQALADLTSPEGYDTSSYGRPEGHADAFYAGLDQAKKDKDEADRKAKEEEEARKAKMEALLTFLATYFPETYAAYMQKMHEAEEAEWLESIKNDPELSWLYDLMMDEKKKREEAAKAAEEAAAAFAEAGEGADGLFGGGGGLGGGGGGGLGDLGSDLGGGGIGGGGFGSVGSDWASDLLDDALDSDELLGAQDALDGISKAPISDAVARGADALKNASDLALEGEETGLLGKYGDQLAAMAHAYGLQAAAVVGGAVALYATREQTTEAVAHVAEFVSEKCKPAALDVMDQVRGVAKQTRVNLGNAKSQVVGVARGEEAGGLIE